MCQVMLLWHAYLKVHQSLKGNWHKSITTLLLYWEDLKKKINKSSCKCIPWRFDSPSELYAQGNPNTHTTAWIIPAKMATENIHYIHTDYPLHPARSHPSWLTYVMLLWYFFEGQKEASLLPSTLVSDSYKVEISLSTAKLSCIDLHGCKWLQKKQGGG